jgi:hypothetical protein
MCGLGFLGLLEGGVGWFGYSWIALVETVCCSWEKEESGLHACLLRSKFTTVASHMQCYRHTSL